MKTLFIQWESINFIPRADITEKTLFKVMFLCSVFTLNNTLYTFSLVGLKFMQIISGVALYKKSAYTWVYAVHHLLRKIYKVIIQQLLHFYKDWYLNLSPNVDNSHFYSITKFLL